jgi:tRNA G37 N-methylase Trm5
MNKNSNTIIELFFFLHVRQVLIDKNPQIKTVVNKMTSIDTTFRFFRMEVLAGEDRFETEVKENGCRFKMDYSKVWMGVCLYVCVSVCVRACVCVFDFLL